MSITPQLLQSQYLLRDMSNTLKDCVKIQAMPGSAGSYIFKVKNKKKAEYRSSSTGIWTSSHNVLLDRKWGKTSVPILPGQWVHRFTKRWSWKRRSCSASKECAFLPGAWKYALQLFLPTVCLSPPPPPRNVCISNHTLPRIYSILSLLTM